MPLTPLYQNPGTPGTTAGATAGTQGQTATNVSLSAIGTVNNSGTVDPLQTKMGHLLVTDPRAEKLLTELLAAFHAILIAHTATNNILAQLVRPSYGIAGGTTKFADEVEANDIMIRTIAGPQLGVPGADFQGAPATDSPNSRVDINTLQ